MAKWTKKFHITSSPDIYLTFGQSLSEWAKVRQDKAETLKGGTRQVKIETRSRQSGQKCIETLVAPYRAILRYYRCDTPYCAILFQGGWLSPKLVRYPRLVLGFTQAHLCDTPFCNISRNNCAIPHKNKHENVLRYYRYKYCAIWKVSLLGL